MRDIPVDQLLADVRACTICSEYLPLGPRPVVQFHVDARILVVGQAPGRKVHESGRPFDDASGVRLREWMGIGPADFYDPRKVAIMGMGLCYPGTGPSGDLPPRPECAPTWHQKLMSRLEKVELRVVTGRYALSAYLPDSHRSVAGAVMDWRDYWPGLIPLPHPSWRNNGWLRQNPWFESELVPALQARVRTILE